MVYAPALTITIPAGTTGAGGAGGGVAGFVSATGGGCGRGVGVPLLPTNHQIRYIAPATMMTATATDAMATPPRFVGGG
jgi:hypothetical protein